MTDKYLKREGGLISKLSLYMEAIGSVFNIWGNYQPEEKREYKGFGRDIESFHQDRDRLKSDWLKALKKDVGNTVADV